MAQLGGYYTWGGNLSTVLRMVHLRRSLSRSDLATATGLNRSTIKRLIAELGELGLVAEGDATASAGMGRPSHTVSVDERPVAIAVNPEVDAITIGAIGLGARVVHHARHPVGEIPSPADTVRLLEDEVRRLVAGPLAGHRIVGIGLAVPGLVRANDGLVRWAPHLGWSDVPLARLVSDATGYDAVAGNDASLGALAESLFGAGRGVRSMIYLNGGASGIGGGIVADGRPLVGKVGFAGEFGHNTVSIDDPAGRGESLEDSVRRSRLMAAVGLDDADDDLLERAILDSTAPEVRAETDRQRIVLAGALGAAINILDPELVVLGGFLATLLAEDPEGLHALVAERSLPYIDEGVALVPAALGSERLLVGAAELAFEGLLRDPVAGS